MSSRGYRKLISCPESVESRLSRGEDIEPYIKPKNRHKKARIPRGFTEDTFNRYMHKLLSL